MAINNTDYVSLRRLLEYHKEVVQPAIEDAGKVNDVGYMSSNVFQSFLKTYSDNGVDKQRAEIPFASNTAAGILSNTKFAEFDNVTGAATSAVFDNGNDALEIVENELKIPVVGATNGPRYGALSKDDYDLFNSAMRLFALDDTGTIKKPTFANKKLTLTYAKPNSPLAAGGYNTDGVDGIISAAFCTQIKEGLINAVTVDDVYDTPTISASTVNGVISRTLYIPMASTGGVEAGLLSNDDYKKITALDAVIGDVEDANGKNFINTLYEVVDFLNEYESSTNLMSLLNDKASLSGTNTFTNTNTFNNAVTVGGTLTVNASHYAEGPFYVENTFNVNSPIIFGDDSTYSFKNSNATKNLKLPFEVDGVGIAEFLTVVKYYGVNDILTSTGVLNECPKITAESFAGWLA